METCPLLVLVTWWFCGYCEVRCCFIGMATTGHLALFVILFVFVFGSITFSTDGNGNSMFRFHLYVLCSSVCTTCDLGAYFCITIPLHFLYGRHTVSPLLKDFKLVALCRLLKLLLCFLDLLFSVL